MLRLRGDQWERIRDHFPEEHISDTRPGRKPVPTRAVLEAVLWILNSGAQWHLLPQCYPNYKTVHRRFQRWCQREVLREILTEVANMLCKDGAIDEHESFIDATFAAAKGVATLWASRNAARRENLRACRSAWAAALCEYTCDESSRSHPGATQFRLLHVGGQAGASHWQLCLR